MDPRCWHYWPFRLKCPKCGAVERFTWGCGCPCTDRPTEMQPGKFTYFLGWIGILMPRDAFQAKKDWWNRYGS